MDNNNVLPKMLTVKDIAEHLNVGHNKAYAIVRLRGFPKVKIGRSYMLKGKLNEA